MMLLKKQLSILFIKENSLQRKQRSGAKDEAGGVHAYNMILFSDIFQHATLQDIWKFARFKGTILSLHLCKDKSLIYVQVHVFM